MYTRAKGLYNGQIDLSEKTKKRNRGWLCEKRSLAKEIWGNTKKQKIGDGRGSN